MTSLRRSGKIWAVAALALASSPLARADDLEAAMAARMGDYRSAVERWSTFAQQGDPDAAYRLGEAYELGHGVPRDPRRAERWYRIAASNGSGQAAYALGQEAEQTERPDGLPQDPDAAVAWYRQALAAGDPRAKERLAALGAGEGEAVKPPPRHASVPAPARVITPPPQPQPPPPTASTANFDRAVGIWREHGLEGTDSAAIAALVAAAKQGQPIAEYDLAYAYEHGLGIPAEPVRAYAWYQRAQRSTGPERLREAARTNARLLGDKLSEAQKQAADHIDMD